MSNYVFTGLDENYWTHWGSSWIYSLREVAKYGQEIVVVDCGLSDSSRKKIVEKNATIIKNEENGEIRLRTIKEISKYAKSNKGNFVYWDADVFFEECIDDIFKEIKDRIVFSENKNIGFVAGPYYQWVFLEDVYSYTNLAKQNPRSQILFNCVLNNFEKFTTYVSNTWNFTDLKIINDKNLEVDGGKPKVIHPTGLIKFSLENKGFLFHERKNEEYLKFIENKTVNFRKLIKKS